MMFRKKKLNVLVTGAKGQLGSYLVKHLGELALKKSSAVGLVSGIGRDELDICDTDTVAEFFSTHNGSGQNVGIDCVVHCAAATDTAAIEHDPYGDSYDTNVTGTRNIASSCAHNGIKMVHISTDYVLSELSLKHGASYAEHPVNAYGVQKLLAEREVELAFASRPQDYAILRPSWMFGNSKSSFIEKLLASIARSFAVDEQQVRESKLQHFVVDSVFGRPTHVSTVAECVSCVLDAFRRGKAAIGTIDCQPHIAQVSRFDWARDVVQCMLDATSSSELAGASDAHYIIRHCEVVPCNQAGYGGMRHPGKVGDGMHFESHADVMLPQVSSYVSTMTSKYMHSNLARLVELVNDEYKKAKHP